MLYGQPPPKGFYFMGIKLERLEYVRAAEAANSGSESEKMDLKDANSKTGKMWHVKKNKTKKKNLIRLFSHSLLPAQVCPQLTTVPTETGFHRGGRGDGNLCEASRKKSCI